MQSKISIEKYLTALNKLEYIKQEKIKYYKFLETNEVKHINTNKVFETTITFLNQKNTNYKQIINIKINNYLKKYNTNKRLYNLFNEKINYIANALLNNLTETSKINLEINTLLNKDSNIEFLLNDINRLSNNIKNNNIEIRYLKSLQEDEKASIEIINNFQKNFTKPNHKTRKKTTNQ